jgi:hypothetical protein
MYQNQDEVGGPMAANVNPNWRPLPISWVEDFLPEPVAIRLPEFHSGISSWPRPAGEKCGKRLRPIFPGGFRATGKLLPTRATLLSRDTPSNEEKIRP